MQLDLLLDGRFLLFHLLDLIRKLLPLVQQITDGIQIGSFVSIICRVQLIDLLCIPLASGRYRRNFGHHVVFPEVLFLGNEVVQNFFVGCDLVNHQFLPENKSSNVPAVKTADGQIVIDLSHVMCRDFAICPLICGEGRDCLAFQPGLLSNDQAVKVCQKQRMFLTLVDGICTAYFQTGGLGEALRHIILQITALPHSLVVDIPNGIADFIVVHLKC